MEYENDLCIGCLCIYVFMYTQHSPYVYLLIFFFTHWTKFDVPGACFSILFLQKDIFCSPAVDVSFVHSVLVCKGQICDHLTSRPTPAVIQCAPQH